jgi:hypothetical protein
MADTRIVAVVCNNDKEVGTSYTVVLEQDGTLVKVPRWSYVYAIRGTRRLTEMFEQQLATTGVMSTDERQELFGNAEDY